MHGERRHTELVLGGLENKATIVNKKRGVLTEQVLKRAIAISVHSVLPWSRKVLVETCPKKLATSASYPKVKIRALWKSAASRSLGQKVPSACVQVFSRPPFRPWTNTKLSYGERLILVWNHSGSYILKSRVVGLDECLDTVLGH